MANNQNQEELNRLEEDGRIDQENFAAPNDETLKEVAKGKKTLDSVDQYVDVNTMLATAMENSVYLNMLGPCMSEGINITDRLKEYFIKNKIKPADLEKEIQEEMTRIRININKDAKGLVFDAKGFIDVDGSIRKAQRQGVPVAKCVGAIILDEGRKVDINVSSNIYNIAKSLDLRDDSFYENLFKFTQDKMKDIDSKYQVDEIFDRKEIKESKINKAFETKLFNIRDLVKKKLNPGRNAIDKAKDVMSAYYQFKELKGLDVDTLEGFSSEEKDRLRNYINEVEGLFRERFNRELALPDFGDLSEEEAVEFLEVIDKDTVIQIKKEELSRVTELRESSQESIKGNLEDNKKEIEARNLINGVKLFKSYSLFKYAKQKESLQKQFPKIDLENYDNIALKRIESKVSDVLDQAEEELESDNLINFYGDLVKRHFSEKYFDEFDKAEDTSDLKKIALEFNTVCMALDAVMDKDRYIEAGVTFEKDLRNREKAMNLLKDLFPEAFFLRSTEVNGLKDSFDMVKLYELFMERYKDVSVIDKIDDYRDLISFSGARATMMTKSRLTIALLAEDHPTAKEITKILNDQELLDEVREKSKIQEKMVVKEKRLTLITSEILDLISKQENNSIKEDEEVKLVKLLAIVSKEYRNDFYDGMNALHKMARAHLALYIPEMFDDKGMVDEEKIDNAYAIFLKKRGEDIKDGSNPLQELIDEYDKEIEKELLTAEIKRNSKELAEEESLKNINRLENFKRLDQEERILKFIRFAKKSVNDKDGKNIFLAEDVIESIEKVTKNRIRDILEEDNKGEKEAQEIFERIDNFAFDEGMYYSMMRELRSEVVKSKRFELGKKYLNEDKITDENGIKSILSIYLGTKRDVKNALFNKRVLTGNQKIIIDLMKKISPDLVEGKKDVNKDVLLQLYNKTFGEELTDIRDAYTIEENRLLENGISMLQGDVLGNHKSQRTALNCITSNQLVINTNLQTVKLKERNQKVRDTLSLIKDIQKLNKKRLNEGLTLEDDVNLVKSLASMIGLLEEKEERNPYVELSDADVKFDELRNEALAIAYDNIAMYFPKVMTKGGKIYKINFEEAYKEFLDKNGVEIPAGVAEGKTIFEATTQEYLQNRPKEESERINIEAETIKVIQEIDDTLKGYEQEKNDTIYLNIIHTIRKMVEKTGHSNADYFLKNKFDKYMPGIYDLALETKDKFVIDDQYLDSLSIIAGKKELDEINKKYFPKGEKGRTHTKIEDINVSEQNKMIQIAIGTIVACERFPEYQAATKTDTKKKAVNLLERYFDNVLDENGNFDKESVFEQYSQKMSKVYKSSDRLIALSKKKLYMKVVSDIIKDDKINSQYVDMFKNNALRYEINKNHEEAKISSSDMDAVFKDKGEDLVVGKPENQASKAAAETVISWGEMQSVVEVMQEDIMTGDEYNEIGKENQGEASLRNNFVVEEIDVSNPETQTVDNHPVEIRKKNIFATALDKFSSFIKGKVDDIKKRIFGDDNISSSSGTDTNNTTTTSSGGANKDNQSSVKSLTGYDPVSIDYSKLNRTSESVGKEADKETGKNDTEIGELE